MKYEPEVSTTDSIVVGLDASSQSMAALKAATELAALLNVELEGLFVEDVELTKICQYPFQQEVRSYTGTLRRFDSQTLSRQMRATAASMRRSMEMEAGRRSVRWRFEVRRGAVTEELLSASRSAAIVSLGRASRQRISLGSTVRAVLDQSKSPVLILDEQGTLSMPFVVLFTGDAPSERALRFATRLVGRQRNSLRVLVHRVGVNPRLRDLVQQVEDIAAESDADVDSYPVYDRELNAVAVLERGTLFVPKSHVDMLHDRRGASVVVP